MNLSQSLTSINTKVWGGVAFTSDNFFFFWRDLMRKISLITVAVLAALSANVYAANYSTATDGSLTINKDGLVEWDTVTIAGVDKSSDTSKIVSVRSPNTTSFKNVIMDGATGKAGSYLKTWTKEIKISNLQTTASDSPSINALEFYGSGDSQSIKIDSVVLAENSTLRIQDSGSASKTSLNISDVYLGKNTALAFGSLFKSGPDTKSINSITANQGGIAAVANLGIFDSSSLEVGEINVDNTVLTFSGSEDDLPDGVDLPDGLKVGAVPITGKNGTVAVNMSGSTSNLVLADVGDESVETALNVNFSEEAFSSNDSNVTIANKVINTSLNLKADNAAKGSSAENVEVLNKLVNKVDTTGGQTFTSTSLTATSDVFDTVTAQTNEAGEVDTSTMRTHENAEVFSFAQLHSVGVMQWREEMNHMQLRLGEIRDAAGYNNGAWARIYNGKDKYGSQDVENKYYGVQVGYDHRLEGTNWIIGGAFSYARGDSTFSTGEGDNHNFTFTGYGTWLADNGLFVDVTGKIGRLSNDITIDHYTSDYDTNAVSVTAEAGWRFALNDIFYVEPQAEMMYGHIMSADYRTQTYKADTEAVDMWVGRLGFQTGLTCPEKKGGVYFRASVLHDFDGDAETKFTGLKSGDTRKVLDELGGTWYEMGIGANYNVTDNTYLYADFQYANGGEIDTPWRWNLGVRVNF